MVMPSQCVSGFSQVVASPVIGKVLVVGLDRSIGTISGGFIGWACFEAAHVTWHDDYEKKWGMLSSASFFAAFLSMIIAWKVARLETTPKLFTLTFILVAFGADDPQGVQLSTLCFAGAATCAEESVQVYGLTRIKSFTLSLCI